MWVVPQDFPGGSDGKASVYDAGDPGSIPGLGRSSGEGLLLHSLFLTYEPYATATAKSLQSCPTLCDPIDDSPPGSPIPGILQARVMFLELLISNL